MATLITAPDGPTAYLELVQRVREYGDTRSPRGEKTRDIGFTVVEIDDPSRAVPVGVGRGLNRRIIAAEAVQLVGAFSDPGLFPDTAFAPYRERDGRFWGAYGDRIGYQLLDVVRKLNVDDCTRQAVITIWDPKLDNVEHRQDYPCTVALQFEVNYDGMLCMNTVMRSQDVWLGTPYDWAQFTVLQRTVATLTGRALGWYRHTTMSTHLYERNVPLIADKLHAEPEEMSRDAFPPDLARNGETPLEAIQRTRRLPYVDQPYRNNEHWYRDALGASSGAYIKSGEHGDVWPSQLG